MRGVINAFAPSDLEMKKILGWEMALEDKELAMKTATWRLFNIAGAVNTMECELYEQDSLPESGKIGDGIGWGWANSGTTGLKVTADLAWKITNYAALKVENEIVIVKSVDVSASTIEVYERWYGSTSAAAHADQVEALIIGFNYIHGVKDIEAYIVGEDVRSYFVAKNTVPSVAYTKENLTELRKAYGEAGMTNYIDAQVNMMDKNLLINMNKSVLYSSGEKPTATKPWMVVGLLEEASTRGNLVTTFGAISSVEKLNAALTASRNKGGIANTILCGPASFDDIQKLAKSETSLTVPSRLQLILWESVSAIQTKIGMLMPVLDLTFPDDKILVLNSADLFYAPFAGFELPGANRTTVQESTRNDQSFIVDSICQGTTYYVNTNKNMTLISGISHPTS